MQILNALHLINHLQRDVSDHKGTSGKLVIIGGANTMAGSIVLAGLGALYTGSGWVKLIPLDSNFPNLIDPYPELMIYQPGQRLPSEILQEIKPDVIVG
jgi:NAD(P)H-hydrate repair Nnr-like enzyme with NAD(P)H-hydrate dehydratase domain